ncbi:hypothetical protein M885DRAFT_521825 [Pelagophyceae sp. CCMP2097]|nr:hypothetical protein M885DRAFT_521825 [Pelagophyceae sp. CCMP2097]
MKKVRRRMSENSAFDSLDLQRLACRAMSDAVVKFAAADTDDERGEALAKLDELLASPGAARGLTYAIGSGAEDAKLAGPPLYLAAQLDCAAVAARLIEAGASMACGVKDESAFEVAVRNKSKDTLKLFLDRIAQLEGSDLAN